jgi:hypothetical protein
MPAKQSPRHKPDITLPSSYNVLNFTQIQTRHHEKEPSVIILTLYRPGNHNAFTDTMREEIERAYGMFDADERVKCIVVTGDGRIFCAGADLDDGFGEGVNGAEAERVQDHRDGYVERFYCCTLIPCLELLLLVQEKGTCIDHIDKEDCAD